MAQLTAEEQGGLGGASSGILPTHWAKSGMGRAAWSEAASRKSSPAGETWNLEKMAINQKHNLVKWSPLGKCMSQSGIRSREAGPVSLLACVGAPAAGFKCSASSASCGAMARSGQDLRLKGPGDSSSGQELRCKKNDRWGSCYQTWGTWYHWEFQKQGILEPGHKVMTGLETGVAWRWVSPQSRLHSSCLIRTSPGGHSRVRSWGPSCGGERSAPEPGTGLTWLPGGSSHLWQQIAIWQPCRAAGMVSYCLTPEPTWED